MLEIGPDNSPGAERNGAAAVRSRSTPVKQKQAYRAIRRLGLRMQNEDVLTRQEYMSIVAAIETIDFLPNCPLCNNGSASSILAYNVY